MQPNLAAAIFGISGTELSGDEMDFFADVNPYGFILFQRNCESPKQIQSLIDGLRDVTGRERLPILIDQEGGRVARLKPPHWPVYPPAKKFADMYAHYKQRALRGAFLTARLIAHDLYTLGITVDCAPVADLNVDGAHDVIGDRAYGKDANQVAALAGATAKGLMEGGIVPVLKHIPGHGRATADSHLELPCVDAKTELLRNTDFVPFKALANLPMAMTAHVLYSAFDDKCLATVSRTMIDLIRREIGFNGLLMSDDLSMKAMQGDFTQRTRDTLNAGCDVVLHCNGNFDEMQAVAEGLSPLAGVPLTRANLAMKSVGDPLPIDIKAARKELEHLLGM
ncbi:MAG: beta-N-acetylhexosaminidase [Rickettsiales bacterium]|nr:beta-N-acetylhexosaminidase [Rickettsiales bacterium]